MLFKKMTPQRFWDWFIKNEKALFNALDNQPKIFRTLKANLERIDKNLTYEISIIKENGKRGCAISADGRIDSFPIVIDIVNQAPIDKLVNWEVFAFRQKDPNIGSITFNNGFVVDLKNIRFNYSLEEDSNQISIRIYCEEPEEYEDLYYTALPILFDALIGEYDAVTKIKHLNLLPLNSKYDHEKFPMEALPKVIEELKEV